MEIGNKGGFSLTNDRITKSVGLAASAFLGVLIEMQKEYCLGKDTEFYQTYEQITDRTKLSKHSAKVLSDKLEEIGLISTQVKTNFTTVAGFKIARAVRYYSVNALKIQEMIKGSK